MDEVEWSTVAEIGGGMMVVKLDEVEVEVDVPPLENEHGAPVWIARRLDTGESIVVEDSTEARPLRGCLGCSCGECD